MSDRNHFAYDRWIPDPTAWHITPARGRVVQFLLGGPSSGRSRMCPISWTKVSRSAPMDFTAVLAVLQSAFAVTVTVPDATPLAGVAGTVSPSSSWLKL